MDVESIDSISMAHNGNRTNGPLLPRQHNRYLLTEDIHTAAIFLGRHAQVGKCDCWDVMQPLPRLLVT